MRRKPLGRTYPDPRYKNNYPDSCVFNPPKDSPEYEAVQRIFDLVNEDKVILILPASVQKEIDHPNTPPDVKRAAAKMLYTIDTPPIIDELKQKDAIREIYTGKGKPENYAADAEHVSTAYKYGGGYFITTDKRILKKRDEDEFKKKVSQVWIVTPSEWLKVFEKTADA